MGVLKDKKTGKYYIRFKHNGTEYEKWFRKGPAGKFDADSAYAEIKQDARLSHLSEQGWSCFDKMKRAKSAKTFKVAAAEFTEQRSAGKPSSIRSYRSIFNAYLLKRFGDKTLRSITESDLRSFMTELEKDGLSKSRVNTIMALMRSILGQAVRDGEISRDPSECIKRLEVKRAKVDPFADDDLALVLSHMHNHYRPFFTVQAFTGARPNELLALRWRDIDWEHEQININKGRVRGKEGAPKTSSGERLVPMTQPVKQALQLLKDQNVVSMDGFIFTNTKGRPIDNHLGDVWDKAVKAAGLRHRPAYQLRHTFITQCIIKGFPLPYIAKLVGHRTIDTLIRHYAGWIDKSTKEQEDKLRATFVYSQPTGELRGGSSKIRSRKALADKGL